MPWITTLFRRRRSTLRQYLVDLPDGTERSFDLEPRTTIGHLLEVSLLSMSVPSQFHEMFCIISPTVVNLDDRRWLRPEKTLKRELKGLLLPLTLHVQVLLYPRDHYCINHRVTKHLLYSQVKMDLSNGKLKCTGEVMTRLAGLVAQAELGNHSEFTLQTDYMSQLKLMEMSPTEERQAIEQHRIRRGLNMEECIDEFLSISETLNGYGTHKFDLYDSHNRLATLACGPLGIEILMGSIQTIQFHWESITTINVHNRNINFQTESSYNQTGQLYSFRCTSPRMCRNMAVLCVSMRNYYCNSEVVRPTSKLRRLFSARIARQPSSRNNLRRNPSAVSSFSNPRFRSSVSTQTFRSNNRSLRNDHRRGNPQQLNHPSPSPTPQATPTTTPPPPQTTSPEHVSSPPPPPPTTTTTLPSVNLRTSSSTSFTLPLLDSSTSALIERGSSASPPSAGSPTIPGVPSIVEEMEPVPQQYNRISHSSNPPPQTTNRPSTKKATTLPTNMNPAEIMNFNYLGAEHGGGNGSGHTHTRNHNQHMSQSRKSLDLGRRPNGYHNHHHHHHHHSHHNGGLSDNFDCINELLEEGLEKSSHVHRPERVSIGGEIDRRKVFPVDNGNNYRNRSYTLQNPKKGGNDRRTSNTRPLHRSANSDPSKLFYSSSSSLYSGNSSGVATMANQLSLATLSQDSSSYVDPHIKSLVFGSSSQADATEL